ERKRDLDHAHRPAAERRHIEGKELPVLEEPERDQIHRDAEREPRFGPRAAAGYPSADEEIEKDRDPEDRQVAPVPPAVEEDGRDREHANAHAKPARGPAREVRDEGEGK